MNNHPLESPAKLPKPDPEDLNDLADDLHGALHRHNDACRANPDIQGDLMKLRDKARRRYEDITEGRKKIEPKRNDFVP